MQHCSRHKCPCADMIGQVAGDLVRLVHGRRQCVVSKKFLQVTMQMTHHDHQQMKKADGSITSSQQSLQLHQRITKRLLPPHVACMYENAIMVCIIGGEFPLVLRANKNASSSSSVPLSTMAVYLHQLEQPWNVELFSIGQLFLAKFLCNHDVCVSLTMDGWSKRNLKGFYYVFTAHLVNSYIVLSKE